MGREQRGGAREVVIAAAARTPVGKFLGGLSSLSASELGAVAIRAALARALGHPPDVGYWRTAGGGAPGYWRTAGGGQPGRGGQPRGPDAPDAPDAPRARPEPAAGDAGSGYPDWLPEPTSGAAAERTQRVDGVIMGCVLPAGVGMAPARQAAIKAGLPPTVPALTVNKVCGSSLVAVALAAQQIQLGEAEVLVAGGMESMSNAPHLLPGSRTGQKMGDATLVDHMIHDGLWCAWEGHHMGQAAEAIAARHGASRQEQDAWSLRSHRRATAAIAAGAFQQETVPVEVLGRRGRTLVDTDECPRADTSAEALAGLRPVFAKDGCVTAGNSSQLADGAAALVLMSRERAAALDVRPLARYVASANAALEPLWLFEAPVPTVQQLLQKTGTTLDDYDLLEVNEAFAAQMVADGKLLGWDPERVNVHGGAIALGHPLGCSGARLLTTLLYALRQRGGGRGLGVACLGGGEAYAIAVEAEAAR